MHCKDTILRTQNNWLYSKLIPNSGSFKTEKESNIVINLLSLNRKGIVKNWLGYLLSVSLSVIKMKDYEKVSVHIVFIGRYQ